MPAIRLLRRALLVAFLLLGAFRCVDAEETRPAIKPFPQENCLVSGEKIDPQVPPVIYKGQEFRFCCKGCVKKFSRDPDKYAALLAGSTKH